MALTKCGGCGKSLFEMKTLEPTSSRYKINVVQCSFCGVPVGTVDYLNTAVTLEKHEKKVDALSTQLRAIAANVSAIVQALKRR